MAKSIKGKLGPAKAARRRDELRRNLPKPTGGIWRVIQRPDYFKAILIVTVFAAMVSMLVIWARSQVLVAEGQIMTDTRLHRLNFSIVDEVRTSSAREEERLRAPDVYRLKTDAIELLRRPLQNLPVIVAEQKEFEKIDPAIRQQYDLDATALEVLGRYVVEGNPSIEWMGRVDRLLGQVLVRYPIVPRVDWDRGAMDSEPPRLIGPTGATMASWQDAIALEDGGSRADLRRDMALAIRRAGFNEDVIRYVSAGVASNIQPTYALDAAATKALADARADEVKTVVIEHSKGEVIYKRGDALTDQQLAELKRESDIYFGRHATSNKALVESHAREIWLPRLGIIGLITVLLWFAGGLIVNAYPRIRGNALRLVSIALLMTGMLAVSVVLSAQIPKLIYPAAIAPALFVTVILLLSYDQRLALFLSTVYCILLTLALGYGVAWFALLMVGCGTTIAQLGDVRNRNSLIRASIGTAAILALGTVLLGLYQYPWAGIGSPWSQIIANAAWAVAASLVVGFLMLGILPSIERMFDITTGMTLAELRDPSRPLLRQLQQRAPGTYNHSLQVANIAEAAADAIGADSLLVFVGALYHDIGKMNKPEYFVENQAGGFNKHAKLRPAMSLLVIIGHVKDGIELAREYGLPRKLLHFIEAHHGTTLVEYFYHAAKTQAETDDKATVEEVEFRYPGPKPRTREVAILMLADAVESASRTMTDPNPSRLEGLVRELSRKRLLDGQFDDCDLTFRELGLIEDAITARLCAIHHARISYPTAKGEAEAAPAMRAKPA